MYAVSKEVERIAETVLNEYDDVSWIKNGDVKIAYLMCDGKKTSNKQLVYADTEKVRDKYRALIGCDFIITFYRDCVIGHTEKQKEILMWHELKHIGYEDGKCFIVPHDVGDFKDVIQKYGIDWMND